MAARKGPTANEMIRNGGIANFVRAVRYAARYSDLCSKQVPPKLLTLREYRDAAGVSKQHWFREQKAWRACVGSDVSILELVSEAGMKDRGWTEAERED